MKVKPRLPAAALPVALIVLVVAGLSIVFARQSGGTSDELPAGVSRAGSAVFAGDGVEPTRPAPSIDLRNSLGRRVTLAEFRGRPLLVTFLYSNCPDVCPLITANLRAALGRVGPRSPAPAIVAVSVDPTGDTPAAVNRFLEAHDMTGRMQYLIGSRAELARTWRAWGVGSERDTTGPDQVAHSSFVYGIGASGRLTTVYASDFDPADLAHDVPLLARR